MLAFVDVETNALKGRAIALAFRSPREIDSWSQDVREHVRIARDAASPVF